MIGRGVAYRRRKWTSYGRNEGPVDREGCGIPQNGGNGPPTVETGVLLIGRGVAFRKTDKTDLLRSKGGSCSSGGVWCTAKRTKQTCVGVLRSNQGGGVWRTAKQDSTGYCSSPPSPSSSLHGLPSTSSSLHGLLFIQPPPRATPPATVQPPLHRLLFIQPSTPRGPVHPEATPPLTVHPPPCNAHCSSKGSIDWLQLAAVEKESLDRVQLTAINRSLGFSSA